MTPDLEPHSLRGTDEGFMRAALELAHRGLGWVSPNPPVGCLLVKGGTVIGRGWHNELGGLHAETAALADAGDARGATAYVTLEPCSHAGRQPPCCDALIAAGVSRVVYAIDDADPRTCGRATGLLAAAGIEVITGVLADECRRFLEPYLLSQREQRPFVHLKLALSLDARMACAGGHSQWISGPESLGLAHFLRQSCDAVLVGPGTVLADDPRLTVRSEVLSSYPAAAHVRPRDPVRVVLDPRFELLARLSELRLSVAGHQRNDLPGLIVAGLKGRGAQSATSPAGRAASAPRLSPLLMEVAPAHPKPGGRVGEAARLDFADLWHELHALGIRSLLVEGGAGVAAELIAQRAVDRLTAVYAPLLLGSDAISFAPILGLKRVSDAVRLIDAEVAMLGTDVVVGARFDRQH